MSTVGKYAMPVEHLTWDVSSAYDTRFSWEYDDARPTLLALYQKGKDKQWDSSERIDWSIEVDPGDVLGTPEESLALYGTRQWDKLGPRDRAELRQHLASWQFSQFLHGEQGAMICSARIVESVPDLDSKFYACTQVMDEARHAETYSRFLQEKVRLVYPINPQLKALLDDVLTDSRWDMPYLGMQVLIEGLALAAFGVLRDLTTKPLPKQILAYVMQDEARHVAFGRLALRDYYAQLSRQELAEREEFVIEGSYLMRDRFRSPEIWENLGYDVAECLEYVDRGPRMRAFRTQLFTRLVPCIKDIGLWGERVRAAYADMGVLKMAEVDLSALMRADEDVAEKVDAEKRELAVRKGQVEETIAAGSSTSPEDDS